MRPESVAKLPEGLTERAERMTMGREGVAMLSEELTMGDERMAMTENGLTRWFGSLTMGEIVDGMAEVGDTMADERGAMGRGEMTMANMRATKGFRKDGEVGGPAE